MIKKDHLALLYLGSAIHFGGLSLLILALGHRTLAFCTYGLGLIFFSFGSWFALSKEEGYEA